MRRIWFGTLTGIVCVLLFLGQIDWFSASSLQAAAGQAQANTADTWDVSRLYPNEAAWQADIRHVEEEIGKLAAYKGKLANAKQLYAMLNQEESIMRKLEKAYTYAHLLFDTDTVNPENQRRLDKVRQVAQKLTLATSFTASELAAMDDAKLKKIYRQEKKLERYKRYIRELRKEKAHILSEKEERLLALTSEATGVAGQTYRYLLDSDLVFPAIQDINGKKVQINRTNYASLLTSPNRELRRRAFEATYGTYGQYQNTFASLLQGEVRKHIAYAKARNYPSARYAALHAADIPESVYDNVISTVRRRVTLLHRYAALRKKLLGLPAVHKYDLYVPLFPDKNREYSLDEAKTKVREGLAPLGPDYRRRLDEAFTNRWMDVYSRKNKTGGAYQTAVYGYPPYVLLNYHGRLDDVLTMAHELGHAMHSYYANETQDYLDAGYGVFVAEVASTVNESMLLRGWIAQAKEPEEKAALLNRYLDTFQGTLFTQTLLAEFERDIHRVAEAGETLTADYLAQQYRKLVGEYYGPSLVIDPLVGVEWARIPHFYKNFYVYQYATGFSAATVLADELLKGEGKAQEKYLDFLRTGGAKPSLDALAQAGVNLRDPHVISRALDVFEETLEELERLANELSKAK
ncbi:oligoendopeptidase F [Aneurinibacillus migulanus]|uniref:Oligopeptidase F n=1 Tax=Aneurinibacillus migulanus TaxID=47500 RepID=A0A1G8N6Q9_ANEMI|nr:oligoendopeptidase F [Aneurinibacillus migulanus]MED0894495.1 oligoendopeptidase F [Aneurinibacillus migulanus]MED1616191.1 oligoendopeptidase F [Aneurinibacillus migulanus]GED13635.1 oligoendopeptidase F [Aneurinibacillus migulanus]SDI75785.1 oligoendopeptidase F [Aneurinibacillus migulanus]